MEMPLPKFPLGAMVESTIDFFTDHFAFITKGLSKITEVGIDALVDGMLFLPPPLLILLFAALAFWLSTRRIALFTLLGLLFIWNLGLWEPTVSTIALVLIATLVAVVIGIPIGIMAALFNPVHRVTMPVLDFMQTMPAFVYLIPAIPFFGLGPVSAIFATVIFAMPPAIRMTCLGIEQVPADLIEAADAFGSNRSQKLFKVQLPLAKGTIMAGVNQTIMLSLSMVVIAAMIGAGGLGGEVWKAIQRLKPGMGFEAGLGVVIVAIILDRITQRIGRDSRS
ncbi:ABC transporter permease [Desulfuromonas acetexigens]|jgi:glycine betaine/proline transport system permease protein|uniref:Proline/glycine betaine ABC transporter permease n=1 Tax=Trichloromonas acetexigens TaxID=38815 RepID=A0A550JIR9_9BACT|nr:proline/glycine betaine ABC transporter permease [Desulfuromonas acetexigens]TRO83114.1 proline/glycine betaine ABC transporter permease [Desulfuromonas acetexigens]